MLPDWSDPVVPPSLNVRDLLAVTDGLDVVGSEGRGGAEESRHALAEAVANCNKIFSQQILHKYFWPLNKSRRAGLIYDLSVNDTLGI